MLVQHAAVVGGDVAGVGSGAELFVLKGRHRGEGGRGGVMNSRADRGCASPSEITESAFSELSRFYYLS